jgi:hypothetical protein
MGSTSYAPNGYSVFFIIILANQSILQRGKLCHGVYGISNFKSMYDLRNIDLEFLHGKSLTQICFGRYDIQFNFKEEITISSGDTVEIVENGKKQIISPLNDCSLQLIQKLLEKKIVRVSVESDKNLKLFLDNDVNLLFLSTDDASESYTISWVGGYIVV